MPTASTESRSPSIILWILIVGGIGFAAGFFGPIVLVPEANQGPMVGIFISGPASTVLGALLCVIVRILKVSGRRQWQVLWTSAAAAGLTTLFFVTPQPEYRGYILDAQVESCQTPSAAADEAIAYWEKRVAAVTWAAPRAGWQADARRVLQNDQSAVLKLANTRVNKIYVNRKPWNKGSKVSRGWRSSEGKSYYANGSCQDYAAGSTLRRFVVYDMDSRLARRKADWPPREAPALLNLQVLEPVPDEYQKFAAQ